MTINIVEDNLKHLEEIKSAKQVVQDTIDVLVIDQNVFSVDNSKYINPLNKALKELSESEQQTCFVLNNYNVNIVPEKKNHIKKQECRVIVIEDNAEKQNNVASSLAKPLQNKLPSESDGDKKVTKEDNNKSTIVNKEEIVNEEKNKPPTSLAVTSSQGKKLSPAHSFSINNCSSTNSQSSETINSEKKFIDFAKDEVKQKKCFGCVIS